MRRAHLLKLLPLLFLAGCGDGPDYPADWPALRDAAVEINGEDCPDLSGDYPLTMLTQARSNHPARTEVVVLVNFLTATAGQVPGKGAHSNILLQRMVIEGPTAQGITLTFYDRKQAVLSRHELKPGVDFLCQGEWISDAIPEHTRAKPPVYYAKDVDGRLIGQKAFAGFGLAPFLGVFVIPVYVSDRSWWRLEPNVQRQ